MGSHVPVPVDAAELKTKQELIEEVWINSNLTWRQAEHIIQQAVNLGESYVLLRMVSGEE